ncbi:MAG: hypothetical protein ABI169_01200, partial [Chitinophagaceae bacterium]
KLRAQVVFMPIVHDKIDSLFYLDPKVDVSKAFVPNFIPLPERENYLDRMRDSRGRRVAD